MRMKLNSLVFLAALALLTGCSQEPKLTPSEHYRELNSSFRTKYKQFQLRAHSSHPGKELADVLATDPREEYSPKFLKIAKENPKDPIAEDAALWVVCNSQNVANRADAIRIVNERYIISRKMIAVVPMLKYQTDASSQELLQNLSTKSPHKDVRNQARLILAEHMGEMQPEEAKALLRNILKESQDDVDSPLSVYGVAKADLFDLEHLSIGATAPELEGEDVDGKKLKLSDYRGKVILLSFFGDW